MSGAWLGAEPSGAGAQPLHVLHVFQPEIGGVPKYAANLAHGLRAAGWRVSVACAPDAWVRNDLDAAGFDVLPVKAAHRPHPLRDAHAVHKIARWCREQRVSLIHGHSTKASLLVALAGRLTGVPSVYTPHTWAFQMDAPLALRAAYAVGERQLARRFHAGVMAVSESERVAAFRWRVARDASVRVVRTGLPALPTVDRDEARRLLGLEQEEVVAVWVGRVAAQKRPDDLVPIARAVAGRVTVLALCAGLEGTPLAAKLRAAGVRVVPSSSSPAIVYAAGDIALHTSQWESCPLVVLEAMSAGLPVVAYWVGGVPEQVRPGKSGYLAERGNVEELSQYVLALAGDPARRAQMGEAARLRAATVFDYQAMLEKTIDTYMRAVERPAGAAAAEPEARAALRRRLAVGEIREPIAAQYGD